MHIIDKPFQGDDLGEDCGTASSEVQAQYFEWESSAQPDLETAFGRYTIKLIRLGCYCYRVF